MKRSIDISKIGIRVPAQVGVCSPSSRKHSEAVDAGAWSCKGSLSTLVRGCKQDAKVRWLVKVNSIESLSGKVLRNLDLWPGFCFQVSVSKSNVLLAVYPIQSFQSLIILKHLEATSRLYVQWHLYPGYSWSAACLLPANKLPGAFKKSGKGFRHCVVNLRQEGSSLCFKFLVYTTLFPFPFSLLHAHTHVE